MASYGNVQGGQGTAAEWTQINPVLPLGWLGYETDTRKLKIGDGSSDWNTLPYWHDIIPYGSCWGNEIAWSQASAVQNTWYAVSDATMEDGLFVQASHDGSGKITVQEAGKYLVNYSMTVECNTSGKHVISGIMVNGADPAGPGWLHHETQGANAEFQLAGTAILALEIGDTVQMAIMTPDTGTPDLSVDHLNITVVWLGV
jgi:hypothetical protein